MESWTGWFRSTYLVQRWFVVKKEKKSMSKFEISFTFSINLALEFNWTTCKKKTLNSFNNLASEYLIPYLGIKDWACEDQVLI